MKQHKPVKKDRKVKDLPEPQMPDQVEDPPESPVTNIPGTDLADDPDHPTNGTPDAAAASNDDRTIKH